VETKVNLVVVGVFVIVLTVTAIASVLWLSSGKYYRKSYDVYRTYMSESVAGLNLNAPVRYRGVDVGRVRSIRLAPGNVEVVEVMLDIERGTPVKTDTVALLETQGLTGIAFVDLTAGHRDSPPLEAKPGEPYPEIQSGPSLMGRLESSVPVLLAGLSRVADNVNATLDEDNRRALKATLADLQALTRVLAARSTTIDAGLRDAAKTMRNAERLTAALPQLVERVEASAEAFDRMTGELGGAGTTARATLERTRGDLQQFTGETLPELRDLVAELRTLTATLQGAADKLERDPSILLFGRTQPRPGPGE
jgi:phospholipid/cholesterol/gamma-HCH transport system substrate-binding protein